jgi:hypothetical protein
VVEVRASWCSRRTALAGARFDDARKSSFASMNSKRVILEKALA